MTNFSFTPLSPLSANQENHTMNNASLDPSHCFIHFSEDGKLIVTISFIFAVCGFGLLGNGAVIWFLGFRMKRNPVTTYILNLAVADSGVLIFGIPQGVLFLLQYSCESIVIFLIVGWCLFHFLFSVSQFLLTLISVDRCVSVLFPIWYRCHRPEKLSTTLCALIWTFCFLVNAICITFELVVGVDLLYVFWVNVVICLPLITISTMILFIRFCLKSQQRQRKKLLLAILVALFFFLFLAFPLNVLYLIYLLRLSSYDDFETPRHALSAGYLCASLNSCVNPLIYFLVGRKKQGLCTENLRLILQRVFKQEEEVYGEELQPSVQAQLPA
ncbi:hypothetical protein lerEdw1_019666 [Lerista edwardsae]|nr:hypothetical protein lerEdw1_019666 [Lerista edwardsae]